MIVKRHILIAMIVRLRLGYYLYNWPFKRVTYRHHVILSHLEIVSTSIKYLFPSTQNIPQHFEVKRRQNAVLA